MKYYNATIRNLSYRLRKFRDILDDELKQEIKRNEEVIIRMITENQLYERGVEGKGIPIMSYQPYTAATVRIKRYKGQPADRVTLRDTGEFYKSLHVEFDDKGFYVTSTDDKAPELLEKYGQTIFRLTNENFTDLVRNYIRPSLAEKLKKRILNE